MPESDLGTAYRSALEVIAAAEPDVADAIAGELTSQRRQLKLVASENYASPAVLLAMGNWLSRPWPSTTPRHSSTPNMPTSSHTRGSTPTWLPTGPSWPTASSNLPC